MADYTQDANCLQSFILDDGAANTNDRSGSNNLTLNNGTWEASNDGYTFDSDATGAFTPTLTDWQTSDVTIAVLTTVQNADDSLILKMYQASDAARCVLLKSNHYSDYRRAYILYSRQYSGIGEFNNFMDSADGAKQWLFGEYNNTANTITIYRNTTKTTIADAAVIEYGTMAMDTGQLGNASTNTIYQVAIFNRLLSAEEKADIVANGLVAAGPSNTDRTPTIGSQTLAGIAGRMDLGMTIPTEVDV